MKEKEKNETKKRFLSNQGQRVMLIGIVVCLLICSVLFSLLGVHMTQNNNNAIDSIGEQTMSETSFQLTQRFEMVMKQRLTMVEALAEEYNPPEKPDNENGQYTESEFQKKLKEYDELLKAELDKLKNSAVIRGFRYVEFLRINEDHIADEKLGQTADRIFGDFSAIDYLPFRTSVLAGEDKIAVGTGILNESDAAREDIVLFSVPCTKHIMPVEGRETTGKRSMALVAGITNQSFVEMLGINAEGDAEDLGDGVNLGDNQNAKTYIVRKDFIYDKNDPNKVIGTNSFVLKPEMDEEYECLSVLLEKEFGDSESSIETVILEMNDHMQENKVYSNIFHMENQHIHMYCNKLGKSEWYLVSITDNSNLNAVIKSLSEQWVIMISVSVVTIFVMLISIFVVYIFYNKKTMAQLENARQEALDANKAKSEFLSNMSHDIRTPMNAIVGMTAIATANINNRQQVQDCLKKITLSSKHLLGLINDVLDMSKIESGKMTLNMEQISLREVMNGISTIVQPQIKIKKQKFDVYIHDIQTESVYCDSVRLNQVLLNLLSNAIKFTPENGTIEIALHQEESPVGENFVRNHIDVTDSGIGMTPEFLKKIFESFTREDNMRVHKTEGTGLGMTITKYIIDAMKGSIDVESELGKGTHFHVVLDLEKVEATEEDMILPDWKMLVVDDDEQLCRSTVASLKTIGVRGDWVLSGEDAVQKTVKAHKSGRGYDIILLDWKLPGIDGLETARQIRKELNDEIPILLISAYDWAEMEQEAREAGISGFISKPLFKSTLYYGLRKYTGAHEESGKGKDSEKESHDLSGVHLLLAEDNDLNWEIAEMLLSEAGVQVERAENGKICVEMLQKSEKGTYDAILMDIRMPIMTGYEATVAIRALDHPDKDLPIIAMTADAFADDMKKCLDCGMNAHIPKPIDMDLLKATLAKFIRR